MKEAAAVGLAAKGSTTVSGLLDIVYPRVPSRSRQTDERSAMHDTK